jgi:hypothetical protein
MNLFSNLCYVNVVMYGSGIWINFSRVWGDLGKLFVKVAVGEINAHCALVQCTMCIRRRLMECFSYFLHVFF